MLTKIVLGFVKTLQKPWFLNDAPKIPTWSELAAFSIDDQATVFDSNRGLIQTAFWAGFAFTGRRNNSLQNARLPNATSLASFLVIPIRDEERKGEANDFFVSPRLGHLNHFKVRCIRPSPRGCSYRSARSAPSVFFISRVGPRNLLRLFQPVHENAAHPASP